MGSGGVGEVPTIFHPRRSRTSNITLSDDQQTHGPFITPIQVALHADILRNRRREEPPPTGVYPRDKEIIQRSIDESVGLDVYICSTTGGGQRHSGRTFLRGPAASLQQRQQRLRSYGVIAAHGDGQTLLPMNNNNNNSNNNTDSSQAAHRHVNNSQQYSSISEIQLRRVPPSTSTSITTIVSNSYSHDPRNQQQGGAGDTDMACQMDRRAT